MSAKNMRALKNLSNESIPWHYKLSNHFDHRPSKSVLWHVLYITMRVAEYWLVIIIAYSVTTVAIEHRAEYWLEIISVMYK